MPREFITYLKLTVRNQFNVKYTTESTTIYVDDMKYEMKI